VNFGYENIMNIFDRKGYNFFDGNKPFNINIFGVRMKTDTNEFDDYLGVAFRDGDGEKVVHVWPATTDPGKHWLENPLNTKGTAIVVPGQYSGLWKIGKHQGKYVALRQKGNVKVYRDNDKDSEHDLDPSTIQEGKYFGINCHRSNPKSESYMVNKWSAGCQVFKRVDDFNTLMKIANISAGKYGNSFTYTLLEESDFE